MLQVLESEVARVDSHMRAHVHANVRRVLSRVYECGPRSPPSDDYMDGGSTGANGGSGGGGAAAAGAAPSSSGSSSSATSSLSSVPEALRQPHARAASLDERVAKLVQAATNERNLCQMSPTWHPWF